MLRRVLVPLALFLAGPVSAQAFGGVSVLSDYRYRGASLSDDKPALQLHFGHDFAAGGYAGLQVSTVKVDDSAGDGLQLLPYMGVVRPLRGGWHWEVGAQYAVFLRTHEYDYPEVFAGIGTEHAGVRVFYSNEYYGHWPAWYATFDGHHALSPRWRLLGHVGVLRSNGGEAGYRRDWNTGVGLTVGDCELQLTWTGVDAGTQRGRRYDPAGYGEDPGWGLRLTYDW